MMKLKEETIKQEKKAYRSPTLVEYGQVEKITQTGLGTGCDLLDGRKRLNDPAC